MRKAIRRIYYAANMSSNENLILLGQAVEYEGTGLMGYSSTYSTIQTDLTMPCLQSILRSGTS
jgi:hypothetical protein